MIWLGLLLAVCWVPGYTGASIPTQWAVLSCLLPLALWREGTWTFIHWLGAAFLAWAAASILWAGNTYDYGWGMWVLSILGLAFWLGSTMPDLRRIYIGLAAGLTVSSALAIAQWFGFDWPLHREAPAGLFYNGAVLGAVSAILITGLLTERLYVLIPLLLPGLALSSSRGAWLAALVGAFSVYVRRPLVILILGLAGLYAVTYSVHISDNDRLFHWRAALAGITWMGHGAGSFLGVFSTSEIELIPLGHAHNDYLQWLFEYGLGSAPLFAIYALLLLQTSHREWPVFLCFAILSLYFFPFYLAVPAFIGALAAGRIAGDWNLVWRTSLDRRFGFLSRCT